MFELRANIPSAHEYTESAVRAVGDETADIMLQVVKEAAAKEQSTHAYVNRTWNLNNHTEGVLVAKDSDGCTVELHMEMPYACYVVGMGLSNINELADWAEAEMSARLGGLAIKRG